MSIVRCDEVMKEKIIFMFSGQGSQYFKMGKELYEYESIFSKDMGQLDAVFQKATGKSIINYIYNEHRLKSDIFSDLFYTHPAIFITEVALARLLVSKGIRPHAVIGSSMGEYAAAVVADVFHPEEVLNILIDQVQLLNKFSSPGGMMAILDTHKIYDEVPILHHHANLAAINNESHFVISANQEGINTVERYLRLKEITYHKLPVTIPFHSEHIELASEAVQESLSQISFKSPCLPFYSSVTGKKLEHLTAEYFWNVLKKPIHFIRALTEAVDHGGTILIDLGPSGTLANLAKAHFRNRTDISIFSILSPYTDNVRALESVYTKSVQ